LKIGPPELPGLIAASVWIMRLGICASKSTIPKSSRTALTMPDVMLKRKSCGAPTQNTGCPGVTVDITPRFAG
jgi:hypothetical protein